MTTLCLVVDKEHAHVLMALCIALASTPLSQRGPRCRCLSGVEGRHSRTEAIRAIRSHSRHSRFNMHP